MLNVRFITYTKEGRIFTECRLFKDDRDKPVVEETVVLHSKETHHKAKG